MGWTPLPALPRREHCARARRKSLGRGPPDPPDHESCALGVPDAAMGWTRVVRACALRVRTAEPPGGRRRYVRSECRAEGASLRSTVTRYTVTERRRAYRSANLPNDCAHGAWYVKCSGAVHASTRKRGVANQLVWRRSEWLIAMKSGRFVGLGFVGCGPQELNGPTMKSYSGKESIKIAVIGNDGFGPWSPGVFGRAEISAQPNIVIVSP